VQAADRLVDDLADAILDGTPIDWAAADSSAEAAACPLLRQLKVLAAIAACARHDLGRASASLDEAERSRANLHHGTRAMASTRSERPVSLAERKGGDASEHWGHLRILEPVGRGASGDVFRAWDTRLDREVALKLLPANGDPANRTPSSIIHEGRLLARVRHPNVVTIHGAEQIGDRIGLWMEFVRGHTLEQLLRRQKVFSAADVVEVGLELCRAVTAVHGAGLLHRDIKAHNVMRAEDGRIVLMDFGTGRELGEDASSDLAGTPLYLAPEVLQGHQATIRSDIYSLGVLLYHLVTGSYPVDAKTVRGVRRAHEREERTAVRTARHGVPRNLARVIERAIDPQPERRYASADALRAALAALQPRSRVMRLAYATGVAAALIVIVAAGWEVWGRQVGSSRTPRTLLSRLVGVNPLGDINLSPIGQPVIAVLPLENLSAEPESDYFVDGLTDEIIRNLAVIQGLQVRSRTSSFAFKDKPRNVREVGRQLAANLIVEGSVLRAGNKLRVNAQLVQVAGDVPIWAERFDRELKDVFAIQDEISRAIVNKLRLTLGRGQRRYDTNTEAYELYLKGRTLLERMDLREASARSAELFQQVIATDPSFAPAYAGLANAYASMSHNRLFHGISSAQAHPIMRAAALKALELDPLLAEAHTAMGYVYSREFDWPKADQSFRRAIDLNPSLTQSYTLYARTTLWPLGKLAEAERFLQQAKGADPLSLDLQRETATVQIHSGRYGEAINTLQRIRALDPDFPWIDWLLARALTFAGRPAEALAVYQEPSGMPPGTEWDAHAYVMAGRRDEAERLAARHQDYPHRRAIIYAALGDKDHTFEALDQLALLEPHRVVDLLSYPELSGLRSDPRFAALRRKFGLP
jgi:TolB-like protein/Flp pilus assembly protein TadD